MRQRDIDRITSLDLKINKAQELYLFELEKEEEQGKRTLLVSKALKAKYERLVKERNFIEIKNKQSISRRFSFEIELSKRELALDSAKKELEQLDTYMTSSLATGVASLGLAIATESDLRKDVRIHLELVHKQKVQVARLERLVENWKSKECDFPPPDKTLIQVQQVGAIYKQEEKFSPFEHIPNTVIPDILFQEPTREEE